MTAHCLRFSPNLERTAGPDRIRRAGRSPDADRRRIGGPYDAVPAAHRLPPAPAVFQVEACSWTSASTSRPGRLDGRDGSRRRGYDAVAVSGWEVESDADLALRFPSGSTGASAPASAASSATPTPCDGERLGEASLYRAVAAHAVQRWVRLCRRWRASRSSSCRMPTCTTSSSPTSSRRCATAPRSGCGPKRCAPPSTWWNAATEMAEAPLSAPW